MSPPSTETDAAPRDPDRPAAAPEGLPRFEPGRLRRELGLDTLLRRATMALLAALVVLAVLGFGGQLFGLFAGMCVVAAWLGFGFLNARAATSARALLPLVQQRPPLFRESEAALRELLDRRGLLGWVRLSIYQVWATIRHAQGRHAEAADLCASVLSRPLGPAEPARADLLLMLTESLLETRRAAEAWPALATLSTLPLSLNQSMQRLLLQTRYEVAVGRPDAATANLPAKVALAELMPAAESARTHTLLADAAEAAGRADQAAWLRSRAELLGIGSADQAGKREREKVRELETSKSGSAAAAAGGTC